MTDDWLPDPHDIKAKASNITGWIRNLSMIIIFPGIRKRSKLKVSPPVKDLTIAAGK